MNYTPEFIKQLNTEFSNVKEVQMFITKHNENPDLVYEMCEKCQITKWRKIKKYPSDSEYIIFY